MLSHQDQLFLKTLETLKKSINEKDPYEILEASARIRKLFLDDFPLVDQVNRDHKLKLTFEVCLPTAHPHYFPKPVFETIQDGLDPDTSRPGKTISSLNRDKFFKVCVLTINGKEYTIKDVVLFEANIMGGIHAGSPKSEKENILKTLNVQLSVGGYASSLRQLKAIGRVVLKTLAPLKQKIEESK